MGSKTYLVGILALAALAGAARADIPEETLAVRFERLHALAPGEQPPRLAGLDPYERQQMRQQMREQWRQSPPEERRREDGRDRWQPQFPSEDRSRLREDMREQRGGGGGRQRDHRR